MATLNILADEIAGALDRPFDYMFKERIKSIFRHEVATFIRQSLNKDGLVEQFKSKFGAIIAVIDDSSISIGTNVNVLRTVNKVARPVRYKTDDPFSWVGKPDGSIIYIYTKLPELPYADLQFSYSRYPTRYIYTNDYIYIYNGQWAIEGAITSIVNYTIVTGTVLVTSINHKLSTSDSVTLSGTTLYDGIYTITVIDIDTFYISKAYTVDITTGSWARNYTNLSIAIEGSYPLGDVFDDTIENSLNNKVFSDNTILPLPEDIIQAIKLKLLKGELSIIDNTDRIKAGHIDNA